MWCKGLYFSMIVFFMLMYLNSDHIIYGELTSKGTVNSPMLKHGPLFTNSVIRLQLHSLLHNNMILYDNY